jgi:hypothetical protein
MNDPSLPEFVDNVDEAMKLIEKMKEYLPIIVRPSCALVKMLRRQGFNVDRYKPMEIHSVFYMSNEAGIACDITPKGRDKKVICSLTQLEVMGVDALADEMRAYQKERIKKLARVAGNEGPVGLFYHRTKEEAIERHSYRYPDGSFIAPPPRATRFHVLFFSVGKVNSPAREAGELA